MAILYFSLSLSGRRCATKNHQFRGSPEPSRSYLHACQLPKRNLAALPEIYREVLILRDIDELNIAETSAALEISVAAVKTRLLRARLMVRDYFVSRSWATHLGFGKA
jgi:DNA-directed RNA polymerase specialized sigma24 family protein